MTTQSQQQQMAQPHQERATTGTQGSRSTQGGATDNHEEFCGGACGAGAGAAVIWRPITVETRR